MLKSLLKRFSAKLGYEVTSLTQKMKSNDPLEILQRLLGSESVRVIIDGGASIGDTSAAFCKFFPKATVHAFEPYPPFQERIRTKSLRSPAIRLVPLALADKTADSLMRVNESEGTNSLLKGDLEGKGSIYGDLLKEKGTVSVKTTSLDDWLNHMKIAQVDILKLDIQGLELKAIRGAAESFGKKKILVILCEIMFSKCYKEQSSWTELVNEIGRHGFTLYNFFDHQYANGQLRQADGMFFHDSMVESILGKGEHHFHSFSKILID